MIWYNWNYLYMHTN